MRKNRKKSKVVFLIIAILFSTYAVFTSYSRLKPILNENLTLIDINLKNYSYDQLDDIVGLYKKRFLILDGVEFKNKFKIRESMLYSLLKEKYDNFFNALEKKGKLKLGILKSELFKKSYVDIYSIKTNKASFSDLSDF